MMQLAHMGALNWVSLYLAAFILAKFITRIALVNAASLLIELEFQQGGSTCHQDTTRSSNFTSTQTATSSTTNSVAKRKAIHSRVFFLLEHTIFAIVGYAATVALPGREYSWLVHTHLAWPIGRPSIPSELFRWYYICKVATHLEDLLFRLSGDAPIDSVLVLIIKQFYSKAALLPFESKFEGWHEKGGGCHGRDIMMDLHHLATALYYVLLLIFQVSLIFCFEWT